MALSNWFIVAWDNEGNNILEVPEVSKNTWSNKQGYRVKIHKNWIYLFPLGDKPYNKRIMTIWSGYVEAGRFHIKTKRGLQNSIYAIIEWSTGKQNYRLHRIFAIAGYGFKDDDWVGCTPETVEDYHKWVDRELNDVFFDDDFLKEIAEIYGRTFEEIKQEEEERKIVIPFKPAICQNQGDIYFHKRLGVPKQFQKVGEKAPESYFDKIALPAIKNATPQELEQAFPGLTKMLKQLTNTEKQGDEENK